jgi:kumamolisin
MENSAFRLSRIMFGSLLLALCFANPTLSAARLRGHTPSGAIGASRQLGRLPSDATVTMAFVLPLRNETELQDLLRRLYDSADPLYGKYLAPQEFIDRFAPTQADYDAVIAYARSMGFTVTGTHANRTLLDVSGPVAAIEPAFKLRMRNYRAPDDRDFYAPDDDPEVPDSVAARVTGVVGLDNFSVWRPHNFSFSAAQGSRISPSQIGTGPGGGLTPGDIITAYNLNGVTANGSGQTLGLFELDGYNASDVAAYVNYYGLRSVPLQNVLVDGFSGRAGSGASEVTLDIELQNALAPGANKIIIYEGPNSNTGVVDTYNRIATDNLAKQISTSWGLSEGQSSQSVIKSENAAFMQMAAQGQSIYAASGDSGAYDNGSMLSVDDPASQPYMVGTGGTHLSVNSGETYLSETTWNNGSTNSGAGGGGISTIWAIPPWQGRTVAGCTLCSTTMRNVPDVSFNSDQYTGYSVYYKGGWWIYGGTSCASPLWAAFTARVNQQRTASGNSLLGFANPLLYQIAAGSKYNTDFHDIADGSTNLYYRAVMGYDNATGWGSLNGAALLADLAQGATPPSAPANLTATAGTAAIALSWSPAALATSYNIYRGTASEAEILYAPGIPNTTYQDNNVNNGATYYYKVSAVSNAGISGYSNEASATFGAPALAITSGPAASPGRTSATISWSTNIASNSVVNSGLASNQLSQKASSNSLVVSHSVTLSGLSRRTTYYYQVLSTAGGTTVSSKVYSLRTQ